MNVLFSPTVTYIRCVTSVEWNAAVALNWEAVNDCKCYRKYTRDYCNLYIACTYTYKVKPSR